MNILKQVTIDGFWGNHTFTIKLNKDINFLIGVNGSGKTTVINMIASALNADFQTLDRMQFKKISIQLAEVDGRKTPSIEIEKKPESHLPFFGIIYKIKNSSKEKAVEYSLSDLEEQYIIRPDSFARYSRDAIQRANRGLLEHLKSLIDIKWLSIHRSDVSRMIREERGYESTVDKKLGELSNDFIKYFSSLTKLTEVEIERFQKFFFVSLVPKKNESSLSFDRNKLNLEAEKDALAEIYEKFKVDKKEYSKRLNDYFRDTEKAFNDFANKQQITTENIVNILSVWKIHGVVQEWTKLNENLKKIYEPRDTFLDTINKLLQRKWLFLNEKNELTVETQSGKKFPMTQLSSGEKQLIIILGEALLQEKNSWIYIADEPELSLHVTWQEQLITSISRINPNTQIIFATHSPDIVSIYDKNVFNMEKYLR